jgi:thymidylate synthase (FAD)
MQFYEPKEFRTQHESNRQASNDNLINPELDNGLITARDSVRAHNNASLYLYKSLIKAGVCREQARGVLPQNLYTEYYGTVNLNNLMKFVSLRLHSGAQWEIQQVAKACLNIAENHFPIAVKAYREERNF